MYSFPDGIQLLRLSEQQTVVDRGLDKTKGGGCRVINQLLRKKYAGLSEKRVLYHLDKNPVNRLMKVKFNNQAPVRPITSRNVMTRVQIDLVDRSSSPLSHCGRTYRYILSIIDNMSRYVWLKPLSRKTSAGVREHLRNVFENFGYPHIVQCDQGHEFKGEVKVFLQKHGIKHITSSPYHPQSQGKVERMHRKLKSMIRFDVLTTKKDNWVASLAKYAHIMNNTPKPVLGGQTPFEVFYGRAKHQTSNDKIISSTDRHTRAVQATIKVNTKLVASQEKHLATPLYAVGDHVLVKIPTKISRVTSKILYGTGKVTKCNHKFYKYKVSYATDYKQHHQGDSWFHVRDISAATAHQESVARQRFKDLLAPKTHSDYQSDFRDTFGIPIAFDPDGDGNFLFSALAHQMKHHIGVKLNISHKDLRAEIVQFLINNPTIGNGNGEWRNFIVGDSTSYIVGMSQDGTYGDHICLQAFAQLYGVQIIVMSTLNDGTHLISPTSNNTYTDEAPCLVIGHFDEDRGAHYVSLQNNHSTVDNVIASSAQIRSEDSMANR